MLSLDRRQFLGGSLCALGATLLPPKPNRIGSAGKTLVVINLAGGNDGLASITPREDDRYYRARPTIGIPKRKLLPLDDLNGFHPALKKLAQRFERGQVCIHQGVGSPSSSLSHFRNRDIWASASTAANLPGTGWMGRAHELIPGAPGPTPMIAAGATRLPLALRDEQSSACVVGALESYRIQSRITEDKLGVDRARMRALTALQVTSADGPLKELHAAWTAAERSIDELQEARSFALQGRFGAGHLDRALEQAAHVIGAGLNTRCIHVTQSGYDTHIEQVKSHGRQLTQLDRALDSFLSELERQGNLDRTLVLVISEFGRRVEESGIGDTAGTDHGAGNCVMALGGNIHAGLHGAQPDLSNLDVNGNLEHQTDFRSLYADVLENWLGVDSVAVLGEQFKAVNVVRPS